MTESDTPMTDAAAFHAMIVDVPRVVVPASVARQLERELREARTEIDREKTCDHDTIMALSRLLAEIALTIKGPEKKLHRHSYADLPKRVVEMKLACDVGEELLCQEREKVDQLRAELRKSEREWEMKDQDLDHEAKLREKAEAERAQLRAEVERLRAALDSIKARVCGEKIPYWTDQWATTQSRGHIADIIDAARAGERHE